MVSYETSFVARKRARQLKNWKETCIKYFFLVNGLLAIFVLLGIFYLLLINAIPFFKEISLKEFLGTKTWNPTGWNGAEYGILSMVVSTLMVTFGAMVIAVPLGIGCAAYLAEVASPRFREVVKPIVEILAGIPSVVIGFIGIVVLGPVIAKIFGTTNGLNGINGSLLLSIMALPTIISISEDAISSVPIEYKKASLALGANRWQTLITVTIPAALSGIIASVMLGMGRAIGETMTVLMATGNAPAFPKGFTFSVRTMTSTIAIELGEVPYYSTHFHSLFAIGLVLFMMTFVVNLFSDLILQKYQEVE
ncbi:MAG: phosphate ABC transporter permease subunit PstC [Halanaerobiales bacterium]|nr:phosphate ABC transporter permease subunit PstC [Halanaerobiales bacterium]